MLFVRRAAFLLSIFLFQVALTPGAGNAQSWQKLPAPMGTPPPPRNARLSVALDTVRNRLILSGGLIYCCTSFNDVWVLTNANGLGGAQEWIKLVPTGPNGFPASRGAHSAVYDPTSNRLIVFGGGQFNGSVYSTLFNDVWVLTNANGLGGTPEWIPLAPAAPLPQARATHQAVYDATTNRMIVYGGANNGIMTVPNDVWVLTNANGLGGTPAWIQLAPGGVNAPLVENHAMVFDPGSNRVTTFGGCCNFMNSTYVLTEANGLGGTPNWSLLAPTGPPPAVRNTHVFGYDAAMNRLIIFGHGTSSTFFNDLWSLTNANGMGGTPSWVNTIPNGTPGSPPATNVTATGSAFDPMTNRIIYLRAGADVPGAEGIQVWILRNANGLSTASTWAKRYNGGVAEGARDVHETSDGGVVAAGWTKSFGAPSGLSDMWIVRLDSSGNVIWEKRYSGASREEISRLEPTSDGGFVGVGLSTSSGVPHHVPLVLKVDSSGTTQWQKVYTASGRDWGNAIKQTSDNGYIIGGGNDPLPFGGNAVPALIKVDSAGTIQWQRQYSTNNGLVADVVQTTSDGGYLAATTDSQDIILLKVDSTGDIQWQMRYGGASSDGPETLIKTSDGGFLLVGNTSSFGAGGRDAWVLKLDSTGNVTWQFAYGGSGNEDGLHVVQTSDGGYIVSGATTTSALSTRDMWILKLSSLGGVEWQRRYDGGAPEEALFSIREASSGGYLAAAGGDPGCPTGCSASPLPDHFDILKLSSDGTIPDSCPTGFGDASSFGSVATTITPQTTTFTSSAFTAVATDGPLTEFTTTSQKLTRCEDTAIPTATPTETPTGTPASTPTSPPTSTPPSTPTDSPGTAPTSTPTRTPTATPTSTPTSTPTDTPGLADTDDDGLYDVWETQGVDGDGDGAPDFFLEDADPNRKDVYVEIDWMPCHKPDPTAVADVIRAFRDAPIAPSPSVAPGIALHVLLDEELDQHFENTTFSFREPRPSPLPQDDYRRIRRDFFGTTEERRIKREENPAILKAKKKVFRYGLFAHKRNGGSGGTACGSGDFIVALGKRTFGPLGAVPEAFCDYGLGRPFFQPSSCSLHCAGSPENQAAVFMHELGHTLGLWHGGPLRLCNGSTTPNPQPGVCFFSAKDPVACSADMPCPAGLGPCNQCEVNCKPNYLSVMNYARNKLNTPLEKKYFRIDFAEQELVHLDESHLDETVGLGTNLLNEATVIGPSGRVEPVSTSVDWDGMGGADNVDATADVNRLTMIADRCTGAGSELRSYSDWNHLVFEINGGVLPRCGALALNRGDPEFHFLHDPESWETIIANEEVVADDLAPLDSDGDGVPNLGDNCATVHNPHQTDRNQNSIGDACEGNSIWEFFGSAHGGVIRFTVDGIPFEVGTLPGESVEDIAAKIAEAINTSDPTLYGVQAISSGTRVHVNAAVAEVVITDPGIGHSSAPLASPAPALSPLAVLFSVLLLAIVTFVALGRQVAGRRPEL